MPLWQGLFKKLVEISMSLPWFLKKKIVTVWRGTGSKIAKKEHDANKIEQSLAIV